AQEEPRVEKHRTLKRPVEQLDILRFERQRDERHGWSDAVFARRTIRSAGRADGGQRKTQRDAERSAGKQGSGGDTNGLQAEHAGSLLQSASKIQTRSPTGLEKDSPLASLSELQNDREVCRRDFTIARARLSDDFVNLPAFAPWQETCPDSATSVAV